MTKGKTRKFSKFIKMESTFNFRPKIFKKELSLKYTKINSCLVIVFCYIHLRKNLNVLILRLRILMERAIWRSKRQSGIEMWFRIQPEVQLRISSLDLFLGIKLIMMFRMIYWVVLRVIWWKMETIKLIWELITSY